MVLIQNLISRREDFKTLYIREKIHKILRICTIQKKIKHHCSSTLPNQKFQEPFIIIQISLFFNRNFSNPKFNIFQSQYQKNSKYILCIVARSTMDKSKDTPISCNRRQTNRVSLERRQTKKSSKITKTTSRRLLLQTIRLFSPRGISLRNTSQGVSGRSGYLVSRDIAREKRAYASSRAQKRQVKRHAGVGVPGLDADAAI